MITIIAIISGLGLGNLLHGFVMDKINVAVSFRRQIFASSYVIAALITLMITLLVNLILSKKIDKINMAES